ncbi:hypothetical protein ACFQ08_17910 [Streptosporangium algeriense]|uniref:Uncharacterized protein n=1 Tax=Streptosporangium algeriense TaxID=1682748 RepID=A0ABW3DTT5_9ACTN
MSEEYLGDIAGGDVPASGPELAALSTVSMEVGRVRARLDQALSELATVARQVGPVARLTVEQGQLAQRLAAVEALGGEVQALAQTVEALGPEATGAPPPRPVDWAHAEDRAEWAADLVAWARDVLITGWPAVAEQLPTCWPRHRDILQDMAVLRCSYETAYDDPRGRAHHAVEYRRFMEDMLTRAKFIARDCTQVPGRLPHAPTMPPRDDTGELMAGMRDEVIAEIYALAGQAQSQATPPDLAAAAKARAEELWAAHGVTQEDYQAYDQAIRAKRPRP